MSTPTDGKQSINRSDLYLANLEEVAPGPILPPLRPGEVLLEEFMRPTGLTTADLARQLGTSPEVVSSVLNGSRSITARLAILLGHQFNVSAELWMNLQTAHDLAVARQDGDAVSDRYVARERHAGGGMMMLHEKPPRLGE